MMLFKKRQQSFWDNERLKLLFDYNSQTMKAIDSNL